MVSGGQSTTCTQIGQSPWVSAESMPADHDVADDEDDDVGRQVVGAVVVELRRRSSRSGRRP